MTRSWHYISQIVKQKTYFVDFRWAERLPLCVWEQIEFNKQPCILLHTCLMRYFVLVFTVYRHTNCHKKITASHDFLGGLAAFIFTAGSRLAALFTAWLQFPWSSQKSQYLYCRVSSLADVVGSHAHTQNLDFLESCVMFRLCLPRRFINWCQHASFLYSGCHHQRVIAFLMYSNACSTGLARA